MGRLIPRSLNNITQHTEAKLIMPHHTLLEYIGSATRPAYILNIWKKKTMCALVMYIENTLQCYEIGKMHYNVTRLEKYITMLRDRKKYICSSVCQRLINLYYHILHRHPVSTYLFAPLSIIHN